MVVQTPLPAALFVNNDAGARAVTMSRRSRWLHPVLVILNAPSKQRRADQIRAAAHGLDQVEWSEMLSTSLPDLLRQHGISIGLSVYFGHILTPEVLGEFECGVVNLHPSYLPWNRGAHPAAWAIMDGSPAGATLHLLDEGIDTGPIVAQVPVEVERWDTAATLYERSLEAGLGLLRGFLEDRPDLSRARPQEPGRGSYHQIADLESISRLDLEHQMPVADVVRMIRARTFSSADGITIYDQETPTAVLSAQVRAV